MYLDRERFRGIWGRRIVIGRVRERKRARIRRKGLGQRRILCTVIENSYLSRQANKNAKGRREKTPSLS